MTYAQNKEDQFILDYFGDFKGTLLEIGANDGITFSNSKLLIDNGWKGDLIEPGYEACKKLTFMYLGSDNVNIWDYGVGEKNEWVDLYESENHVPNGKDVGLVSTINFEETKRWPGVKFNKNKIMLQTFEKHCSNSKRSKFDFISIDAEGMEWTILQQIDLEAVGCKALCVEYNGDRSLLKLFTGYCKGYKLGLMNAENLLFIK